MDCSIWCLIAFIIIISILAVKKCTPTHEGFVVSAPWPYKELPQDYDEVDLSLSAYPTSKEVYRDEAAAWGEYEGNAFPCGKTPCGTFPQKDHIKMQERNGRPQQTSEEAAQHPSSLPFGFSKEKELQRRKEAYKTCKKADTWGVGFDLIPEGNLDKGFEGAGGHQDPEGGPASLLKSLKSVAPRGHPYRRQEHIGYRWKESWRPYYWKNYPNPPIWYPARNPPADQPEMPQDPTVLKMMEKASCRPDLASQGISPEGYRYFWKLTPPYEPLCSDFADKACRNQPYPHFCYRRTYGKCLHGAL